MYNRCMSCEVLGYLSDLGDVEICGLAGEASLLLSLIKKPGSQELHDMIVHLEVSIFANENRIAHRMLGKPCRQKVCFGPLAGCLSRHI